MKFPCIYVGIAMNCLFNFNHTCFVPKFSYPPVSEVKSTAVVGMLWGGGIHQGSGKCNTACQLRGNLERFFFQTSPAFPSIQVSNEILQSFIKSLYQIISHKTVFSLMGICNYCIHIRGKEKATELQIFLSSVKIIPTVVVQNISKAGLFRKSALHNYLSTVPKLF